MLIRIHNIVERLNHFVLTNKFNICISSSIISFTYTSKTFFDSFMYTSKKYFFWWIIIILRHVRFFDLFNLLCFFPFYIFWISSLVVTHRYKIIYIFSLYIFFFIIFLIFLIKSINFFSCSLSKSKLFS
jgi:hypothetical protein